MNWGERVISVSSLICTYLWLALLSDMRDQ